MHPPPPPGRVPRAFTLFELLVVLAVLGILASILLPAIGNVQTKARQAAAQSNLRSIALAYNTFALGGSRVRSIGEGTWSAGATTAGTTGGWAQVLAEFAGLNNGTLYFVPSAPEVASMAAIPPVILDGEDRPTAAWSRNTANLSYEAAVGLPPGAPASLTPLAWTKGLQADGRWADDSPWGGAGGHIAFLDGHVTFYEDTEDQLTNPDTGGSATDVAAVVRAAGGGVVAP